LIIVAHLEWGLGTSHFSEAQVGSRIAFDPGSRDQAALLLISEAALLLIPEAACLLLISEAALHKCPAMSRSNRNRKLPHCG
jgi:hypothetical protein